MKMTKEQAIDYLVRNDIFSERECGESKSSKFYIEHLMEGYSIRDIDIMAWFNTMFQYDIGADAAMEIDNYLLENKDDADAYGLIYKNKELIEEAVKAKGLNLDFSKWLDHDPLYYEYF